MSEDCHDSNNSPWEKRVPKMYVPQNPLDHTCDAPGGDPDCGGCAFTRARAGQQRETLAYPPKALTLTDKDVQFLNELKVTW